ncbi:hypothetical protein GCM10011506_28730 [Marivirga lumbricoides]|uniref:Secretion system C-terminal sorting domain-containing protein n=1 Tax=Marivirga lumbricoides TaxID=1046115 RepID=A0ABQ1MIM6_9BACT|nr:hypothetical protein GCM10011506_28730 [Marivirga lumbricoides]
MNNSSTHSSVIKKGNYTQANSQNIGGLTLLGGNGKNTGEFIVTDENNNTYIIGSFRVSMELEGQTIEGYAANSYYLAKYNSTNELVSFKNLVDSEVDASFKIDGFSFFDDGLLLLGQTNDDLIINENTVSVNDRITFLLKLNTDGTTSWYKEYEYRFSGNSRTNLIPLAHNDTHIFTCFENTTVTKLNAIGDIIDSYYLPTNYGFITTILAKTNNLVVGGYFDKTISIGDVTLTSKNFYETSFISSLNINTYEREWAYHNGTLFQGEPGDSWAQKLFADQSGNIYLKGTFRTQIQWGNDQYQGIMTSDQYISKFSSNGDIDTTIVLAGSIGSEVILNNTLYLINASMYGIDGNTSTSEDNIIVLDNDYNFKRSAKFPTSEKNYQATEATAKNGDLILTGDIDNNSVLFTIDTSDLSIISENKSQSEKNGYFTLLGLESINSTEYIAGNKNGSIQLYNSVLADSSTAIIASVKNKNVENITSFYNATFSYFYPSTMKISNLTNKMIVKGTAQPNFHINENQYDINGNFLAQINIDGSVDWVKDLSSLEELHSLTYDDEGNIYISGSTEDAFNENGITITLNGYADYFVLKLNSSGEIVWFKNFGSIYANYYTSVISYIKDQIIFSGEYSISQETIIEGDGISVPLGTPELGNNILIAFNKEGEVNWAKGHGKSTDSDNNYWACALKSSSDGGFYMTGFFGENNSFGDITLESQYYLNHFVAKYDKDGKVIWANPIRLSQFGFNYSEIGTDENNNVYIQGDFPAEIEFGADTTLMSQGSKSVYIAKYGSAGEFQNVNVFSGDYLYTRVMDVKGEDNLSIGGTISRSFNIGNGSENSYLGNSYIVELCTIPSIPSVPNGLTEVFQADTTSYMSSIPYFNNEQWVLSPTEAGEIIFEQNDSIAIKWSKTYTGEAVVKVKQFNSCGESEFSEELVINVNKEEVTSIDKKLNENLYFYPNPVTSNLNLEWNRDINVRSIQLLDLTGREVINIKLLSSLETYLVNMQNLSQGTYILKLSTYSGEIIERVVKR